MEGNGASPRHDECSGGDGGSRTAMNSLDTTGPHAPNQRTAWHVGDTSKPLKERKTEEENRQGQLETTYEWGFCDKLSPSFIQSSQFFRNR